ncbi:MAG TPA: LytTR family transcriptional regulator, partial [Xanthomonadaceae bacterium]|nr:LytTR family transcriptional regulator [Xanthomonadaceae bacterium]
MTLQHYLRYRRFYEIALWALAFLAQWLANVQVVWFDIGRVDLEFPAWMPMVWEGSSLIVLAALIPLILLFDRRFPLRPGAFRRHLVAHLLFTIPYSLLHVLGMVALRHGAYAVAGEPYAFGYWPRELFYEYLKDFRAYAGFLAVIYLYRFVLLRAQGEARLLDAPEGGEPA